jgi:hypothetical protein
MLNDTDATAGVISSALLLKKGKIAAGPKNVTAANHSTLNNLMTDVRFWSRTTANYLLLDGPLFDGVLKTVTTTVAKEILTCERESLSAFIHHATLFGHWKCS